MINSIFESQELIWYHFFPNQLSFFSKASPNNDTTNEWVISSLLNYRLHRRYDNNTKRYIENVPKNKTLTYCQAITMYIVIISLSKSVCFRCQIVLHSRAWSSDLSTTITIPVNCIKKHIFTSLNTIQSALNNYMCFCSLNEIRNCLSASRFVVTRMNPFCTILLYWKVCCSSFLN